MGVLSGVPDLHDQRLRNFQFLCQPLSRFFPTWRPWPRNLDEIAVTVANRLANLIWRLERPGNDATCEAARWYLDNLKDIDIVSEAESIINPLVERLWRAVHRYEVHVGHECNSGYFDRLVGPSDTERCFVLYGAPSFNESDRSFLASYRRSPRGDLLFYLSSHCWESIPGL